MNGFVLRVIAMATMLTDHIGWNFLDKPIVLTWIGRIAFPIYAFLLADGFLIIHNDRNRLIKHLATMFILAVVSEPGYDLMDAGLDFAHYLDSQSNIITLLLGYAGMLATEALLPSTGFEKDTPLRARIIPLACVYGLLGFANYMLKANFNFVGPWLVIAFYWYIRASKEAEKRGAGWSWRKRFLIILSVFAFYLPLYFWDRSGFGSPSRWLEEVTNYALWIVGHVIAAFILSFYNGELGYHKKWFSILYTLFYPVHTFLIGVICISMGR